ncbi:MAG: ABC transporter permease, partial [Chloroflexota bacterium]
MAFRQAPAELQVNAELFVDPQLLRLTVAIAAPFIVAALGELLMERAGILNVGIEGIMALGAAVGFLGTWASGGSYVMGVLAAMLAGALPCLILAYYGITLRGQQITVGLGLLVFGLGLASLLYRGVVGVQFAAPRIDVLPPLPIAVLSQLPVIGAVLFSQNVLVYLAFALVPAVQALLFATPLGLRWRACGENPRAADTVGIPVGRLRYAATLSGGLLIGLAGAYLPLTITGGYSEGMVGGRGWIALMLVIVSRWVPWAVIVGALVFALAVLAACAPTPAQPSSPPATTAARPAAGPTLKIAMILP